MTANPPLDALALFPVLTSSSRTLLRGVNDILDDSEIEAGKLAPAARLRLHGVVRDTNRGAAADGGLAATISRASSQ